MIISWATKIKAGLLDTHRKRQQKLHPGLTLTGMYNVLEKLSGGDHLTAKEKQIHDELDEAVLEAYGWGDLNAKETHCSVNPEGAVATPENGEAQSGWPIGNLRPSLANEEAPPRSPNGIDAHRATLQDISSASSNFSISASAPMPSSPASSTSTTSAPREMDSQCSRNFK